MGCCAITVQPTSAARTEAATTVSTQRKQLEAAIRESEPRMRFLSSTVENSDDAIVSKTLDGIITSWNKGAERVFGYAPEEAIGQPITIVIPKDRQNEEREILTHIRRGEGVHFETVRQRKQGSLIAVQSPFLRSKMPKARLLERRRLRETLPNRSGTMSK